MTLVAELITLENDPRIPADARAVIARAVRAMDNRNCTICGRPFIGGAPHINCGDTIGTRIDAAREQRA